MGISGDKNLSNRGSKDVRTESFSLSIVHRKMKNHELQKGRPRQREVENSYRWG